MLHHGLLAVILTAAVFAGMLQAAAPATNRAAALNEAAHIETRKGDYPAAVRDAQTAADLYRESGDRAGEASALNNLGVAHTYAAQYEDAAKALRSAAAISRNLNNRDALSEQLMNYANVLYYKADYVSAMSVYDEAQRAAADLAGVAGARRRALIAANTAALYQRLGDDQAAIQLYRRIRDANNALPPNEAAQMLVNLGVTYRRLGDPHKALEQYAIAGRMFARDHHLDGELSVLRNRGIVLALDLGDLDGAIRCFDDAFALATRAGARRQALQARLYRAEARYRSADLEAARSDFEAVRSLAAELKTAEEEWKALYGLGRIALRRKDDPAALILLETAVRTIEQVRERVGPTATRRDFFADKRDVYDAIVSVEVRHANVRRAFEWMERSRARTFQDRIRPNSPPAVLSEIQRALPPGAMLIEYWESSRGAAMVWVSANDANLVSVDQAGPVLPPNLGSASHVIIVPDGQLSAFPFETIKVGNKLLIEAASVSYAPSASILLRPRRDSGSTLRMPWDIDAVIFGDPTYDLDPLGGSPVRLPQSAVEAREIASALHGSELLFLGPANRKQALTLHRAPLMHFATHAVADPVVPERSRLLFSAGEGERSAEYLFLREVYGINLQGTDLLTISACDTERGKQVRGEGVESFSRAFLAAGAASTVTTLWRVEDKAASLFMADFYRRLARGVPKAEALRQTKLRFFRSGSYFADPKHWAAFVLSGEPFGRVPQPLSWLEFSAAACIPIAAAISIAAVIRRRRNKSSK